MVTKTIHLPFDFKENTASIEEFRICLTEICRAPFRAGGFPLHSPLTREGTGGS